MNDKSVGLANHDQAGLSHAPPQELQDKIEILPVRLLDQNRHLVEDLKKLARSLRLEFGWHYLLDLTWILSQLGSFRDKRVLDAGAGTGMMQWYLAEGGAEVISVDRSSRATLPLRFRRRYRVSGLRPVDLNSLLRTIRENLSREINAPFYRVWAARLLSQARDLVGYVSTPISTGSVQIYNQDLSRLKDLPDDSLDAVVSVSALEHNSREVLGQVINEIMRLLKPGRPLLATLVAARDRDWWHEPSKAWCYTEASLRELFDMSSDLSSNYSHYDQHLEALRNCTELRDGLAGFYFKSGENGMPWGEWDPQYQPVGICKVKG